jgi:hypothetical protein
MVVSVTFWCQTYYLEPPLGVRYQWLASAGRESNSQHGRRLMAFVPLEPRSGVRELWWPHAVAGPLHPSGRARARVLSSWTSADVAVQWLFLLKIPPEVVVPLFLLGCYGMMRFRPTCGCSATTTPARKSPPRLAETRCCCRVVPFPWATRRRPPALPLHTRHGRPSLMRCTLRG